MNAWTTWWCSSSTPDPSLITQTLQTQGDGWWVTADGWWVSGDGWWVTSVRWWGNWWWVIGDGWWVMGDEVREVPSPLTHHPPTDTYHPSPITHQPITQHISPGVWRVWVISERVQVCTSPRRARREHSAMARPRARFSEFAKRSEAKLS